MQWCGLSGFFLLFTFTVDCTEHSATDSCTITPCRQADMTAVLLHQLEEGCNLKLDP